MTTSNNVIEFGAGRENEPILEVPILAEGRGGPLTAVKVTVLMNNTEPTSGADHDPKFGISDQKNVNRFWVSDTKNYRKYPPCDAANAVNTVPNAIEGAGAYPSFVTLWFTPDQRYGACSTAHNTFVNTAIFKKKLDLLERMYFQVTRHDADEEYQFVLFLIEVFNT